MSHHFHKEYWLPAEPLRKWLKHIEQREITRINLSQQAIENAQIRDDHGYCYLTRQRLLTQVVGLSPDHPERVLDRHTRWEWEQVEGPHGLGEWVGREVVTFSCVDRLLAQEGTYSIHDIYPPEDVEAIRFTSTAKDRRYCKECGEELRDKGTVCGFCLEEGNTNADTEQRTTGRPGTDGHPGAERGGVREGHVARGGLDRGRARLRGPSVRPSGSRARGDVPGRTQALPTKPGGRRARSADRRRNTTITSGG